jgi:hypothetical protein
MIILWGHWCVLEGAKMSEADGELTDFEHRDAVPRRAKYSCSVIPARAFVPVGGCGIAGASMQNVFAYQGREPLPAAKTHPFY